MNQNQQKKSMRLGSVLKEFKLSIILLSLVLVPILFTYFLKDDVYTTSSLSGSTFGELEVDFKKDGIRQFIKSKARLKKQVSRVLSEDSETSSQMAAMNIAVYLFPDLLHDTHLEKQFALEHFVPLQAEIESKPGSLEAQQYFEALRNAVWNYENPSNSEQGLSEYANKMLKLYGSLSWK